MRILFVSPKINPFDKNGYGSIQRSNLLLNACAKFAHVDVITFVDNIKSNIDNVDLLYAQALSNEYVESSRLKEFFALFTPWDVYSMFPMHKEAAKIVEKYMEQNTYNYIVVRYIPQALYCGLMKYANKLIIDVDDDPLEVARSLAKTAKRFRKRLFHKIQIPFLKININRILSRINYAFYANAEQSIYRNSSYLPNIPFHTIEGVELVNYNNVGNKLFFVGNLYYGPNLLGVDYFIKNIFPKVRSEILDAEFHIGGRCPEDFVIEWSNIEGVKVLGFVPDLNVEYQKSKVVVIPMYSGAGTNIKLLEAMQMMRPVVTTDCGIRGFKDHFKNGKDYLLSNNDNEFVDNIVRILNNETLNHNLAKNALDVINKYYTKEEFEKIVLRILNK